jgi:cell division septation protein DedD
MYSFLFDRKSLILLFAGLATVGGLLFVSGLLVGVVWGVPGAAAPPAPALRPAAVSLSRPCPPATEPQAEPEAPPAESDPPAEQWADLDRSSGSNAAEEPLAPQAGDERAATETAGPPEAPAVPPVAAAEAAPTTQTPPALQAAAPAPPPAALGDARFSLQIGAYRQAENSARAMQDLQRRGYDAYVVAEGGRGTLRTVRIGRYAEREEAERAASEFRRRERREAIVREMGS